MPLTASDLDLFFWFNFLIMNIRSFLEQFVVLKLMDCYKLLVEDRNVGRALIIV